MSAVGVHVANGCAIDPTWTPAAMVGSTAPGQAVAQPGTQTGVQQPMCWWPDVDEAECTIGQSGEKEANAGPDAIARDRASPIKNSSCRISTDLLVETLMRSKHLSRLQRQNGIRTIGSVCHLVAAARPENWYQNHPVTVSGEASGRLQ